MLGRTRSLATNELATSLLSAKLDFTGVLLLPDFIPSQPGSGAPGVSTLTFVPGTGDTELVVVRSRGPGTPATATIVSLTGAVLMAEAVLNLGPENWAFGCSIVGATAFAQGQLRDLLQSSIAVRSVAPHKVHLENALLYRLSQVNQNIQKITVSEGLGPLIRTPANNTTKTEVRQEARPTPPYLLPNAYRRPPVDTSNEEDDIIGYAGIDMAVDAFGPLEYVGDVLMTKSLKTLQAADKAKSWSAFCFHASYCFF